MLVKYYNKVFIILILVSFLLVSINNPVELTASSKLNKNRNHKIYPNDIFCVDKSGNFYFLSFRSNVISKYNSNGEFLDVLVPEKISSSGSDKLSNFDILGDKIVAVTANVIYHFSLDGKMLYFNKIDDINATIRLLSKDEILTKTYDKKLSIDFDDSFPWVKKTYTEVLRYTDLRIDESKDLIEVKYTSNQSKFIILGHTTVFCPVTDNKYIFGYSDNLEVYEISADNHKILIKRNDYPFKTFGAELLGVDIDKQNNLWLIMHKRGEKRSLLKFSKDGRFLEKYALSKDIQYRYNQRFIFNFKLFFLSFKPGGDISIVSSSTDKPVELKTSFTIRKLKK